MAVAFAGFGGLASLFGERAGASHQAFDVFDRVALIGFGVLAAGFALLPRVLVALGAGDPAAWRASGLAMAAALLGWSLFGFSRRRLIAATVGASRREANDLLVYLGLVLNGGFLVAFAVLPPGRLPGVYVAALFGLLVFSAAYFLRTLIPRRG